MKGADEGVYSDEKLYMVVLADCLMHRNIFVDVLLCHAVQNPGYNPRSITKNLARRKIFHNKFITRSTLPYFEKCTTI